MVISWGFNGIELAKLVVSNSTWVDGRSPWLMVPMECGNSLLNTTVSKGVSITIFFDWIIDHYRWMFNMNRGLDSPIIYIYIYIYI